MRVGQVIQHLPVFDCCILVDPVTLPVPQAVDAVGQVGKPRTITGFQTHITPVLLAHGERAELATDECILSLCQLFVCPS